MRILYQDWRRCDRMTDLSSRNMRYEQWRICDTERAHQSESSGVVVGGFGCGLTLYLIGDCSVAEGKKN